MIAIESILIFVIVPLLIVIIAQNASNGRKL